MVQTSRRRRHRRLALAVAPAHAQLAVIDPANLAQAVLIAQRAQRHYEELQAQYRTILRMAQGLGNMEGYRIPTIAATRHDAGTVAVRSAVAAGPQQRRRDRRRVLGHDGSAASARRRCRAQLTQRRAPHAGAAVRHHRDHRLGRHDGRPSGRRRARLPRPAAAGRAGTRRRRAERPAALPRDDGHSRQDRRRRAARPTSGHGNEPAALARARAVARAQQAAPRHRGHDDEHAARHVARRRAARTRRWSPARGTRSAPGGSRERGGCHATRCLGRLAFVLVGGLVGHAQIVVYDPRRDLSQQRHGRAEGVPADACSASSTASCGAWRSGSACSRTWASTRLPDAPRWRTHAWREHRGVPVLHGLPRRAELRRRGRARATWPSASQCSTPPPRSGACRRPPDAL